MKLTTEQIAIIDPNYIFWLLENKIINISNGIQELASENISLDPMPPDLDMVHEDWGDRD